MFPFRKKRDKEPTPPWVAWMLIAFVAYAFVANQFKDSEVSQAINKAKEEIGSDKLVNLKSYQNKLFPGYMTSLSSSNPVHGKGPEALCGQEARIAYETSAEDGTPLPDKTSADAPLVFRIGAGDTMPVFEQGVEGMRAGGKRILIAAPSLAYGPEKFARDDMPREGLVTFEVELLDLSPALPDIYTLPFRIADIESGGGTPVRCGAAVNLDITVWSVDGKKLFSTKDTGREPVRFTVGKSEVFWGLEQGVLGLMAGGKRALIVPPLMQKNMHGNVPSLDFSLPKNQTVLVDIEIAP